jgi:ABC-2 type transport system permease protein
MITSRRVAALARAEAVLLRRNPSALLGALAGPVTLVVIPLAGSSGSGRAPDAGAQLLVGLTAFTLILGVYYNLVTALVARREEFVLKRLRTGEIGDEEILLGSAAPGVAIAWAQIGLGVLVGVLLLDLTTPADPAWLLVAVLALLAGTALCVLLAAAVSTVTGTVETAQLTATPLLILSLSFSGALIPLDELPGWLHRIAHGLPLTPVVDLVRLGLTGTTASGATIAGDGLFVPVVLPVLILGGWFVATAWVVRRWFRWEPRR